MTDELKLWAESVWNRASELPDYQPQTPSPESKPVPVDLIHAEPKGISVRTGAVISGSTLYKVTDCITVTSNTTYEQLCDLLIERGNAKTMLRSVFPEANVGQGRHLGIRLQVGSEKNIVVDEIGWSDCKALCLSTSETVKLMCIFAVTPEGYAATAPKWGKAKANSSKKKGLTIKAFKCVMQ